MDHIREFEKELGIMNLGENEKETIVRDLALQVQTQFLHDVYRHLGEAKYKALEASLKMGEAFYETTMKHLVPEYKELFEASKKTVLDRFRASRVTN